MWLAWLEGFEATAPTIRSWGHSCSLPFLHCAKLFHPGIKGQRIAKVICRRPTRLHTGVACCHRLTSGGIMVNSECLLATHLKDAHWLSHHFSNLPDAEQQGHVTVKHSQCFAKAAADKFFCLEQPCWYFGTHQSPMHCHQMSSPPS